jgi:serine/threonine-protein kinase
VVLGRYRLLRPLGAGAHGSVHLALEAGSGRALALKTLALPDAESRARFATETAAVRRLGHPDIVAVLDAGQSGRSGWIAMELLAGSDLRRYTQPARRLPEAVVLSIGGRLALALAHAHERGVVHRDIKPANVMVDWVAGRVTLTDFGLARLDDAARTRSGLVPGSPGYMAPELLAGAPPDARSDLYALGVLLFELLAGRRPHEAASLGELLHRVANQAAPDLRTLCPELPAPLAETLARALARRPDRRPGDARALASELQAAAALLPAAAAR